MSGYEFEFSGMTPEYGTVTVVADTDEEAEAQFWDYIKRVYPELDDVEIGKVDKIG